MLTFKALAKKLRLNAFYAVIALVLLASTAVVTRASAIYCLSNCEGNYGETFWLSCGSSAGNYYALCPADGGACTVIYVQEADSECAKRAF